MTRAPLRVGVAGAGHWATTAHMPAIAGHPDATLAAIADPDPARVARAQATFDVPATFGDAHEMLAMVDLDAVVVAAPHVFHHPIALDAIRRGRHVLVEKPFTLDPRHGRELIAAAAEARVEIVVGYTWHYNDQVLTARRWIQEGLLGEIRFVQSFFGSSPVNLYQGHPEADVYAYGSGSTYFGPQPATYSDPALAGGGQGQTQLTHSLALLAFLTGLRPARVAAFMDTLGGPLDIVDSLSIRYHGGALAAVGSTGAVVPTDHTDTLEYRIHGTAGHLVFDVMDGALTRYGPDGRATEAVLPPEDRYPMHRPSRNLVDAALGTAPNGSPVWIAQDTVELLAAAYRSAAQDGGPMDVAGTEDEEEAR